MLDISLSPEHGLFHLILTIVLRIGTMITFVLKKKKIKDLKALNNLPKKIYLDVLELGFEAS